MAGLFSGASTGPALEELGASIGKLGMTIYGKLDEAEATSEYQSGQLRLEKMMNQFDQSLSQDPEYDTWGDKNTKAMSDSWDAATKSVKNPKALNALNEWWVGQKVSRDKAINNRIIGARIAKLSGALHTNIDETMTSDASVDQKKARIEGLGKAAVATNVADPRAWEDERARLFKTLDKNDLQSKGLAVMNQQGEEAGTLWMLDPKNSQNLTEQDRHTVSDAAGQSYKLVLAVQGKKADTENKKLFDQALNWVLEDNIPADAYSQIEKMDWKTVAEAGVDGTAEKKAAYEMVKSAVEKSGHGGGKAASDTALAPLYDEYMGDPDHSETNKRKYIQKMLKNKGIIDETSKKEFYNFVTKYDFTPADKAAVETAKPAAGASPAELDLAKQVQMYSANYFTAHKDITDQATKNKIVQDLKDTLGDKYIKDAVTTITTGERGWFTRNTDWVRGVFGGHSIDETQHIADLIQTGKMQEAVDAKQPDAAKLMGDYTTKAAQTYFAATGNKEPPLQNLKPALRPKGDKRAGLRPISELVTPDKKTVFQLWMDPDKMLRWYSLPVSKYKAAKDEDWTKVK